MAILAGYKIPAQFNHAWDHVYAISDAGHLWGCFGRNGGGAMICSDQGDSDFADCLSYPRNQPLQYAGIVWGLTGVCHQAANRILYAAGQNGLIVSPANGYGLSATLYGTYGRGTKVPWPRLSQCGTVHGGRVAPSGTSTTMAFRDSTATQLAQNIHDIYASPESDELTIARQELEALAHVQLGAEYDQKKITSITNLQHSWREEQQGLSERYERCDLSLEDFRLALRQITAKMAADAVKVLGEEDFKRLFGIEAKDAPDLFNLF